MDLQQILLTSFFCVVAFASAVVNGVCSKTETTGINKCLFSFIMAHKEHRDQILGTKECKLELLSCSAYGDTNKCISKYGLSDECIASLETIVNGYLTSLNLNCTVSQFDTKCPDVVRVSSQKFKAETTTASTSSANKICSFSMLYSLIWMLVIISS